VAAAVGDLAGAHPESGLSVPVGGVISTGNAAIDGVIGRGGLPTGCISVFVGEKGSGKTTAAMETCREVIEHGGLAIYLDAERKIRRDRVISLGINPDTPEWIFRRPDHIEGAIAALDRTLSTLKRVGSKRQVIAVLDSANATVSAAEKESKKEYRDVQPGTQARAYSVAFRRFVGALGDSNAAILVIGQLRSKIGMVRGAKWSIGVGNAIEFYSSLMVYFQHEGFERIDSDTPPFGIRVGIETVKNQISPPFVKSEYTIDFGLGGRCDQQRTLIEEALRRGVLSKVGTGWIVDPVTERKWNGLRRFKTALEEDPALLAQIQDGVRARYGD